MEQILKSRYKITTKLAESPFSLTYQGVYLGTNKPVIIKIYKRGTLNSSMIKSMKQRVASFSVINHHGIAKMLDGDYGWQGFYYVREFIEGSSLRELLDKGEKIGPDKACAIIDQLLAALEAAHERGIIHANLKPANIFIDNQGLVKLTDFIIEGEIKGSVPQKIEELMADSRYASPEELGGEPVSPASDIYSTGLILYEILAGQPLPVEKGIRGGVRKLKADSIIPKEELANLSGFFREIILTAIRRDPLLRFKSAKEFRESLAGKAPLQKPVPGEEYAKLFESVVTQYGGEEINKESEILEDVGQVRLRWGKEKHRNWILAVIAATVVVVGIIYTFTLGR